MLIKQSKNSYIRCTNRYGYIVNQLTKHDRVYNDVGANFLSKIKRYPQEIEEIVKSLAEEYEGISYEELMKDFIDFVVDLEGTKFVITGNTVEEINEKDENFTYAIDKPKTLEIDFTQHTDKAISQNTQDFFREEVQGHPLIKNLQFELSSRCNERCIHCYIPNSKKNVGIDMPLNKFKEIIDEYSSMGGISVALSGGEVFLHKNMIEILRYCRKKDLKITILTNLTILTDEHIKVLKEVDVSFIQTSLYSMKSEIHDSITTVKGSFYKTKNSIERLVANDIPVQISCPTMKANYRDYKDVLLYAQSLKIKAQTDFIIMARADLDKENLANRLTLEETEYLLRDIMKYDPKYRDMSLYLRPRSDEILLNYDNFVNEPLCGVGYDNCCITANGDVYPCAGWQNYVLGNLYRQSLRDIWENSEKIKYLRKITQASFPQCLKCEAFQYCSRCLVRNYNESNGDMLNIPKHFCDVAFLNKRIREEYEKTVINQMSNNE